jgi:hypothetical protein
LDGTSNIALGTRSLLNNTSGNNNYAFGEDALRTNTIGSANIAIGYRSLYSSDVNSFNVGIGYRALKDSTSFDNVALGHDAGLTEVTGTNNTFIGSYSDTNASGYDNSTALGNGAKITASNQVVLGNASVTNVITSGSVTATNLISPNTGAAIDNTYIGYSYTEPLSNVVPLVLTNISNGVWLITCTLFFSDSGTSGFTSASGRFTIPNMTDSTYFSFRPSTGGILSYNFVMTGTYYFNNPTTAERTLTPSVLISPSRATYSNHLSVTYTKIA